MSGGANVRRKRDGEYFRRGKIYFGKKGNDVHDEATKVVLLRTSLGVSLG